MSGIDVTGAAPVPAPSYPAVLPGPVQVSAPPRRPASVRRTSHLDVTKRPGHQGMGGVTTVAGAARDLFTGADGHEVLGEVTLRVDLDGEGRIHAIEHASDLPLEARLAGLGVSFWLRSQIKDLLAQMDGTLIGLLVDDLAGAPAPSGYAAIRHRTLQGLPGMPEVTDVAARMPIPPGARPPRATNADVCAGWRALGMPTLRRAAGEELPFIVPPVAPDLADDDPLAWHAMSDALDATQTRRLRRLDVWREHGHVRVDSLFRDVMVDPDLTRRVVHEYWLHAALDPETLVIMEIEAEPRSLPFPTDCPFAAGSAGFLVGEPVHGLRRSVSRLSKGPASCTHLNDQFRSLADVAALAHHLPES